MFDVNINVLLSGVRVGAVKSKFSLLNGNSSIFVQVLSTLVAL